MALETAQAMRLMKVDRAIDGKRLVWLAVGWWVSISAVLLTIDIIYEQTVLTWNRGPQMVGFALMHSLPGVLLLLSFWLGWLWIPMTAGVLLWRRQIRDPIPVSLMAVYAACCLILQVPYGWWQERTIEWWGPSPRSAEYLQYAEPGDREKIRQALERAGYNGAVQAPSPNQ